MERSETKLQDAEAQVEELRLQLDDAMGAEDMLEQLTERNLLMGEVSDAGRIRNKLIAIIADRGDAYSDRRPGSSQRAQ